MRNLTQWSSDDRYEWLSAYIDDELVPHDRQQVEQWLATDPEYQICYRRLMQMRQGFAGLRSQELANLTPMPIPDILDTSCPLTASLQVSLPPNRQGLWKKRLLVGMAGVGSLGLSLLWAAGLRSPWADPVAQVRSSPDASVASVPSPLLTPPPASEPLAKLPTTEKPSQVTREASTLLVSTEEPKTESSLTFALDQPLLAFPADDR